MNAVLKNENQRMAACGFNTVFGFLKKAIRIFIRYLASLFHLKARLV